MVKRITIAVMLLFIASFTIKGQNFNANDIENLFEILKAENFTSNKKDTSLPKYVREYLNNIGDKKFKFSKNQVNKHDLAKSKRILKYIAYSPNYYIIYYEHTGRGCHEHVLILKILDKQVTNMYNFYASPHKSIEELKTMLSSDFLTISDSACF